jgi:membrane protease subunit HflK
MSWNNNDGPWGPSGNKTVGNPWTKKPPSGGSKPPDDQPPPDFDKFFEHLGDMLTHWRDHIGGPQQMVVLIISLALGLWVLSGFYQVATNQVGVVMRFGALDHTDTPGLRYHLPYPVETVLLPNVTSQNEIQIGFRRATRNSDDIANVPEESMMLTQDENIINVEFAVFWRVSDINKFLFEIRDPEQTVKMAAESAMREVIGQNKLQFELTDGRGQIADDAKIRLQKLMDDYNAGVIITQINLQTVSVPEEVKAAFQDVVNARLDQERFQNEAETHANNVIPAAKGEAAKITQQAMAYRDQKIALAQGDADRFTSVLKVYQNAREVTAKRLYLEAMESILGNAHKIILDKSGSGTVPYLPLQELLRAKQPTAGPDGTNR